MLVRVLRPHQVEILVKPVETLNVGDIVLVTEVLYAVAVPEKEQCLVLYAKAVLLLGVGEVLAEQLIVNDRFGGGFDETERLEQGDARLDKHGFEREHNAPPQEGEGVGVAL